MFAAFQHLSAARVIVDGRTLSPPLIIYSLHSTLKGGGWKPYGKPLSALTFSEVTTQTDFDAAILFFRKKLIFF